MSNALQTLRFEDTEVTALDCNTDEPVFVASPIAKKLAYESAKDMLRNLDSDEKGRHIVPTLGGEQEMSVITLPGLIHALNNRRPGAVKDEATRNMVIRFQRWVNHELVPTVMRTGRYEVWTVTSSSHAMRYESAPYMRSAIAYSCGLMRRRAVYSLARRSAFDP